MPGSTLVRDRLTLREQEILARLSTGLSDQQIADDLYLSLNTVKWYNRQIYSKLGVSSRTQAIAQARLAGVLSDTPGEPSADTTTVGLNLPAQWTPFIGREHEIAEAARLLRGTRLLTLTGTGGVGKTRLALMVVERAAGDFTSGVTFVDLAPLADSALVVEAIAGALGVVESTGKPLMGTLKRVLEPQSLLLLVDNFEHVVEAAPLISELLTAAPGLKVLATSRQPLRLAGEQEYPVPPLSLPEDEHASVESLRQSEAGALFVRRAQMIAPRFEATHENAPAIAHVCRRLDGLPLAIELAAARTRLLTPGALLERLDGTADVSPLQTLAGGSRDAAPRHRTLRDTMAWSYNLLGDAEKVLFARLSVFRGGRSLEAIEAVCGEGLPIDVFDGLASLVDKSLVQQQDTAGGEPRFIMLEMIHEYAGEHLADSGEAGEMRRRHLAYFAGLSERAEPELRLDGFDRWARVFDLERDNLRAALEWALGPGDVVLGARLVGALALYWYGKGHHVEGLRWLRRVLERLDEIPRAHHPRFLVSAGQLAWLTDLDEAQRLFRRALDIARELGDEEQAAWALGFLAYAMMHDTGPALTAAEESVAMFRRLGHQPGIAQMVNITGEIARLAGDDSRARQAYEECLAISQRTGEVRRICYMLMNLGYIEQHTGSYERSAELAHEALRLARDRPDRQEMCESLVVLAGAEVGRGRAQRAAWLLGTAEGVRERMGAFYQPGDAHEYTRIVTGVRAALDDETFHDAWASGRVTTLEKAVWAVLGETQDKNVFGDPAPAG